MQAFFDNLVSRFIGALVRLTMIFVALIANVGVVIYGTLIVALWGGISVSIALFGWYMVLIIIGLGAVSWPKLHFSGSQLCWE